MAHQRQHSATAKGLAAAPAARAGQARGERVRQVILDATIELIFDMGFRALTIEAVAAETGVAKTTIYRRWPNKAALVMDAFMLRVGTGTPFPPARTIMESVRLQMRVLARVFRGRDGALVKSLLAEAQFDQELATAFLQRWTLPRRALAIEVLQKASRRGELRPGIDLEATIDLLYAPFYYRLQMSTGPLSDAYVDGIFEHAMKGIEGKCRAPV